MIQPRNINRQTEEQKLAIKKYEAIEQLARKAGLSEYALIESEFGLVPFFDAIVEECAKCAELQSRNYDGSSNEGIGCQDAAWAIRAFGKRIGNE